MVAASRGTAVQPWVEMGSDMSVWPSSFLALLFRVLILYDVLVYVRGLVQMWFLISRMIMITQEFH